MSVTPDLTIRFVIEVEPSQFFGGVGGERLARRMAGKCGREMAELIRAYLRVGKRSKIVRVHMVESKNNEGSLLAGIHARACEEDCARRRGEE
jgi:hypothetical protein